MSNLQKVKINTSQPILANLAQKFKSIKLIWKIAFLLLILVIIAVSCYFVFFGKANLSFALFKPKQNIDTAYQLVNAGTDDQFFSLNLGNVPQVKDKENPINGVLITKNDYETLLKRSPIAVTINNHQAARHQHGLSKADTVLEVLAEGGITRYVAIFHGNYDVSKIGPVRSLRYYMIEFASGYADAVILHHGWAGYDNAPWERYKERADARGAVRKWGIKSLQTAGSTYRDMAKSRSSGHVHSLYSDFGRITSELNKKSSWKLGSQSLQPLKFKYDAPQEERGSFVEVSIKFIGLSTSQYQAKFVYDKENNCYKRFIGGNEDIDLIDNKQICPKNVIIEWHNYQDAQDGHSRLIIDMIGEDKVTVLRDGKVFDGVWKKADRLARTKYYDSTGAEIELVRGLIWIAAPIKVGNRLVSDVSLNTGVEPTPTVTINPTTTEQ